MRQALLAALILSATGASMGPHRPMTSSDYFALQGREADRTIREDLLSLLVPVDRVPWTNRAPINIPVSIPVRTRPIGTSFPGICERSALTMQYAAMRPGAVDGPIKPYLLDARMEYHVARLPSADEANHPRFEPWASSCQPSELKGTGWFEAADVGSAIKGGTILREVADLLRSGRLKLASCTINWAGKPSCEAALLEQAKVEDITMYLPCDATTSTACATTMHVGDMELTIQRKATVDDEDDRPPFRPDVITSVSVAPIFNVT